MSREFDGMNVLLLATGRAPQLAAARLAAGGASVVAHPVSARRDELVRKADVIIVDGAPESRAELGEGDVRRVNPNVVYCALTPYGDHGPMAGMTGDEIAVQALTGTLRPDPTATEVAAPRLAWATEFGALRAVAAITAALLLRARTGEGAYLDLALVDSLVDVVDRMIDPGAPAAFSGVFATADGRYVALEVDTDSWAAFCDALGLFEVRDLSVFERISRANDLRAQVVAAIGREACSETLGRLLGAGIAAVPALTRTDALEVPHLERRRTDVASMPDASTFGSEAFPDRDS